MEELFSFSNSVGVDIMKQSGLWFSGNGERLSYITFNDTAVPEVRLPIYSEPDSFQLYTEQIMLRYTTVSNSSFSTIVQRHNILHRLSIRDQTRHSQWFLKNKHFMAVAYFVDVTK